MPKLPTAGDVLTFPVMHLDAPRCTVSWLGDDDITNNGTYVPVIGNINAESGEHGRRLIAIYVNMWIYHPAYADTRGRELDSRSLYKQECFELRSSLTHTGLPIPGSEHFRVVLSDATPIQFCRITDSGCTLLVIRPRLNPDIPPTAFAKDYNAPNEYWDMVRMSYGLVQTKENYRYLRYKRFVAFKPWSGQVTNEETRATSGGGSGGGAGGGDD